MGKNVKVTRPHNTTKADAVEKLRGLTGQLASKYGVTISDNASGASVKGRGISGGCVIDDSNVTIDLTLGMLLRPISGRIEQGVLSKLKEHFG